MNNISCTIHKLYGRNINTFVENTNYCENSLTELPFFHTVHLTCELKMILTDEFKEEKEILTQFDPTYDGVKSSI